MLVKSKMLFFLFLTVAAYVMLWTHAAFANKLSDCKETANGSQGETGCYVEEFERLGRILETKHKEMLKELKGDLKDNGIDYKKTQWLEKKAIEAHKYWKKYRSAYCGQFTYESVPGTGASSAAVHCSVLLTNHRIEELEAGR